MLNMSSHPPDPPIASQSISRDSPDRGLRFHIVEKPGRKNMARLFTRRPLIVNILQQILSS
jgi:hypothetical protein